MIRDEFKTYKREMVCKYNPVRPRKSRQEVDQGALKVCYVCVVWRHSRDPFIQYYKCVI
jgi:hypothetical protein